MDKLFSLFGKFMLILFIVGTLVGGGYFVGTRYNLFGKGVSVTPTPKDALETEPTPQDFSAPPPPPAMSKQLVSGGVPPSGGLSFFQYTIAVPTDWVVSRESNESVPVDTVTVTKGEYQIKIFQAATGGAMCLYPGDPAFEGPSSAYDTFVDLTLKDGTILRRSGTNAVGPSGKRGFTVCQKSIYDNYQQPTPYGHASYNTPATPDQTILTEMDAIIASFEKS
jgi:hypothetical protein